MIKTVEATIDPDGVVHLKEAVYLKSTKRALVTILEEEPIAPPNEEALMSEKALAEDWKKPEEDEAWSYLQSDPLS